MVLPPLTPEQEGRYNDDRRPEIYASLVTFLVLNNLFIILRCMARYRHRDRNSRRFAVDDALLVVTGLTVNAILGNLWVATGYGLGLHIWRVLNEDPAYPSNMSNMFKHVWVTMVLTGPIFCLIKLTLLFFYRRLFLINQRWLQICWWANIVYVTLWVIGATGFYLFQCSPPEWYFLQYYSRYGKIPPGGMMGQCNATTTDHVSLPLIFGVIQDILIMFLPMVALWRLRLSIKKRIGLTGVFCVGILACALDLVRIVELRTNTDDKTDPSYGVAIFLILSAASEVAAVICICLPVIVPWLWREYIAIFKPEALKYGSNYGTSSATGTGVSNSRRSGAGFRELRTGTSNHDLTYPQPAARNETDSDVTSEDVYLGEIGVAASSSNRKENVEPYTQSMSRSGRSWLRP